ncbi:MAG: hypothetical protein AAGA65_28325, partial [Actinomycetota bacterium]
RSCLPGRRTLQQPLRFVQHPRDEKPTAIHQTCFSQSGTSFGKEFDAISDRLAWKKWEKL